jgi:hypothetical protein
MFMRPSVRIAYSYFDLRRAAASSAWSAHRSPASPGGPGADADVAASPGAQSLPGSHRSSALGEAPTLNAEIRDRSARDPWAGNSPICLAKDAPS